MKKATTEKRQLRRSVGQGLLLVIVAALTLEATSLVQFIYSQKEIRREASLRAENQMEATRNRIMDVVNQTEAAVRNSVWITQWALDYPDSLFRVAQRIVEENPVVVGSTVALVPGYNRKHKLFSPYVCVGPDGNTLFRSLATEEYDYPSQEWFVKPIELDTGYWSEPYIDIGGGEMLMTTYSLPIKDRFGRTAAVLTADMSLDWLTDLVGSVKVYPSAYSMMISRSGRIMVCPDSSLVMQQTVGEVVSRMDSQDTATLGDLSRQMLAGNAGNMTVTYRDRRSSVFFAPVERTGWSMSIVIPEEEIYGGLRRVGKMVFLLQVIGVAMLLFILWSMARSQIRYRKLNERKDKMARELQIASNIQMSMVPKIFPPFPERNDLDMSATIVPAKEVGGDLYDFYIRDEKLFFCVGDVSGKGIPASLVMAVTRTMFRTVSAHEDSPQKIVSSMNDSMADMNESNMFVTFFCGVLDLKTGHLRYCNAGHNAPFTLTDAIKPLPVQPNLPLGIIGGMNFCEQEMALCYDDALFLYTDGLTEAENLAHEQFGEERICATLRGRKPSDAHLENIKRAVADYVGEAPQSDDLTMLFIHYLGRPEESGNTRKVVLHNDIHEIPALAEFVDSVAEAQQLPADTAMNLNLALEEAVSNVMLYAYPEGTQGTVEIEAIPAAGTLTFILSDNGKPFDPTAAPDVNPDAGLDERPIGGLGIHLVRTIMDEISYERRGDRNILTMIKNI